MSTKRETLCPRRHRGLGAALELADAAGDPDDWRYRRGHAECGKHDRICGVRIIGVAGAEFAHPRYATDAAALEAICREAIPDIVVAPATSRFLASWPELAQRLNGQVDTHITSIDVIDGQISAKRWFYRQRLEAVIRRHASPWFLLMDAGCHEFWAGASAVADIKKIEVPSPRPPSARSLLVCARPRSAEQTIRPDAKLLFVAGAGWCKKQADGKTHLPEAETTILQFSATAPAPHLEGASRSSTRSARVRRSWHS